MMQGHLTTEGQAQVNVQRRSWFGAVVGAIIAAAPQFLPALAAARPEWALVAGAIITILSIFTGHQASKSYAEQRTKLKITEANNAINKTIILLESETRRLQSKLADYA